MSTRGGRDRVALSCCALLAGALALGPASTASAAGGGGEATTEVNAFTGALQTRVPISVPAFRGLEPKLALQYSSTGGNGPVGVGWSLSGVSVIERASPGRGVPNYDGTDVFMLDGNDLIPSCGTFGGTHCTRIQSYQRITWDGANNRWYVWSKDGVKSTYTALINTAKGTHRWGLSEVRDTKNNVVTYGYTCSGGDCYVLNVSYNGVVVTFFWEGRTDAVTYAIGGQNTCYSTCYQTCYAATCCDGTYDKYGTCQPTCDKYGTCTLGSYPCQPYNCNPYNCNPTPCGDGGLATMNQRLRSVFVWMPGVSHVRAYKLSYASSTRTGRALLTAVQQYGQDVTHDGAGLINGGTALPAMTMSYEQGASAWAAQGSFTPPFHLVDGGDSGADLGARFADVNGDGRPDLLYYRYLSTGSQAGAYLNTGSGWQWAPQFTPPFHIVDGGAHGADLGARFVDLNGDGKVDLVYHRQLSTGAQAGAYLSTGAGWQWAPQYTPPFNIVDGSTNGTDLGARFIDVNGDGLPDFVYHRFLVTGSQAGAYLNTGNGWSWAPQFTPPFHIVDGGANGADLGARFIDVNGDGRVDLVFHRYYPNGASQKGAYLSTPSGWVSAPQYTPPFNIVDGSTSGTDLGVRFEDVNGDGRPDMLYYRFLVTGSEAGAYLNTGSGWQWAPQFTPPYHIVDGGAGGRDLGVRFIDVNGDGRQDLVYYRYLVTGSQAGAYLSTPGGWQSAPQYTPPFHIVADGVDLGNRFQDANGDGRPDCLFHRYYPNGASQMGAYVVSGNPPDVMRVLGNGLGGTTTVNYVPSSNWANTNLPGGMIFQTVSSITTSDGRGDAQTTNYSYQGAAWRNPTAADPVREFLGFRKATTTLAATGAYSETYYWQRAGSIAKPEVIYKRRANGAIMSFEKFYFTENTTAPYTSLATQMWGYECNGTGVVDANHNYVSGCRRVVSTYEWDTYANMTAEYQYGDYDLGGDERTAVRSFVPNGTTYVVGMPAYEELRAGIGKTGTLLSRTRFFYDGASSEATAPTEGKLTRKGVWNDQTGGYAEHSFGYDAWGNATSITDPLGRTASKTFDATYHVLTTSTTNPLGHVVQSGWDPLGRLTRTTDPDGNVTTNTYDALGRGVLTTKPDGAQVKVEHLAYGDLANQRTRTSTLLPGGQWIWDDSYFDGVGRAYRTVSSTGVMADTIYGPTGKVWKQSLPYVAGETVRYDVRTYDELGREITVQMPDGATVTKAYANGAASTTDAIGNVRTAWFDGANRLTATREVIGGVNRDTFFYYDLLGRRTRSVDALGYQTLASYDSQGRVLQKSDPDQGLWQYRYDDLGRITRETDAQSRVTALGYDALGRVTRRTYHDGTSDAFTFDEAGRGAAKGRLTTSVSASGVTTRAFYDSVGRRTRYEEVIDGTTYVLSHAYDVAGRVATATYPDGEVVTYGYGTSGLATGKLVSVAGSVAGTLVSAIGYSSKGQVTSVTYGNGVTTTTGFDPVGERVTSIQIGGLAAISYGYDGNGRITSMASAQLGLTNWTYGYDSIGRLTRATNTADGSKSETFSYDAGGRMLSKSSLGSYSYGDATHVHAVTAAGANTYSYDANGSMVSGAGRTIAYDQDHRPLSITYGGSTTSFVYDAQGLRVKKTGASGTVVYVGGVQEKRGTAVTKYYFAGAMRVAKRDANGNQFFHADHLGSTRLITNQSGTEVKRYEYAAYGAVIGQSGSLPDSHRYTGHESDDETGLGFFQARYYDPALGRFVQPDSFVPNGNSPQDLDLYAYANNSPINYVDPSGHAPAVGIVAAWLGASAATITAITVTYATVINIAAMVIGTALTFTNNPILQTIGMIMAGMGGAAMFGGPSLFGMSPTTTAGVVALAQSPISPLDPTVKKVIGWAYTVAGFVENLRLVEGGHQANGLAKGLGLSWGTPSGPMSRGAALWFLGKSELLMTAAGWALAYWLSGSEVGRYLSAFASRFIMACTQGTAGPLAAIGSTYDLAYTLKYPDGRVIDLSGGDPNGEAFTFYYHTGFESPGYALGRQHIRVGGRGGYFELGDTRAGFFGPGLGWGGWIGTQKITVIMSPAQANAFVGALEATAAAGGRYQGYHADSHTYVSAALQFATGKSAADLHINPGLIHW